MRDTRSRGADVEPEFWTAEGELKPDYASRRLRAKLALAALSCMDLTGLPQRQRPRKLSR